MKPEDEKTKLVFVYNADGGAFNLLADIAHKILSPATYACNLCALTHSNFGMKREWKAFLETLENPAEFLHADEFRKKYGHADIQLPAVFKKDNNDVLSIFIAAQTINNCRSIEDLKRYFKQDRTKES